MSFNKVKIKQLPLPNQKLYNEYPLHFCKKHQDFFVITQFEIENRSSKPCNITNPKFSFFYKGGKYIDEAMFPQELQSLEEMKPFYDRYRDKIYTPQKEIAPFSTETVFCVFLITKHILTLNHFPLKLNFSCDLPNRLHKRFKDKIVININDVGPYTIEQIKTLLNLQLPDPFWHQDYEDFRNNGDTNLFGKE